MTTRSPRTTSRASERASEPRHAVAELPKGQACNGTGHRAVVDERRLLASALLDVPVKRVVTGVDTAAREPAVQWSPSRIEHLIPAALPGERRRALAPEAFRVLERTAICVSVNEIATDLHVNSPLVLWRN